MAELSSAATYEPVKRLPDTGIRVVIVGSGIGGLTTALECWRKGHHVQVFEKASGPQTEGDYFTINLSSAKIFRHWPELDAEQARSGTRGIVAFYYQNGDLVAPHTKLMAQTTDESGAAIEIEAPNYRHLRRRLHGILLKQLAKIGIAVEYNHQAIGYGESADEGFVEFVGGAKVSGDIVVAADGVGTKSFEVVLGKPVRARDSGWSIYRSIFSAELIEADSDLAEHFKRIPGESGTPFEMWFGHHAHLTTQRDTDLFSWTLTHRDDGTSQESWHSLSTPCEPADAVKSLEEAWGECPEILRKMILVTPKDSLVDWKIMWRDPQPNWASPRGRVLQLGDAAHTFVPASGNGANQAIEDAATLATCLQLGGKENIPLSVKVHNLLRFERVSCCQITGFQNQANRHNADPKELAKKNPTNSLVRMARWIWAHDPEQYAYDNYEKARDHLTKGTPFENTNIPAGYKYRPWNIDELLETAESGKPIVFEGDWS